MQILLLRTSYLWRCRRLSGIRSATMTSSRWQLARVVTRACKLESDRVDSECSVEKDVLSGLLKSALALLRLASPSGLAASFNGPLPVQWHAPKLQACSGTLPGHGFRVIDERTWQWHIRAFTRWHDRLT